MKVRFCDKNKGKGKVLRRLREERPEVDAGVKKCIGLCGPCSREPIALVNGKKVRGKDGDDLYRAIVAALGEEARESDVHPTECDFYCGKILSGQQPVQIYMENDAVFAFHHTNPLWENHVVLLPKRHVESLLSLGEDDNELLLELMRAAKLIAGDFMKRFGAARVYTNLGAYQSSKHLHWHIGAGKQLRPY